TAKGVSAWVFADGWSGGCADDAAMTDVDFSNPQEVGQALEREGAEVSISSWGWSGLAETHFVPKFAEHTEALYGVPVTLNWVTGVFDNALRELPVAGKTIADLNLDVIDKEEESF